MNTLKPSADLVRPSVTDTQTRFSKNTHLIVCIVWVTIFIATLALVIVSVPTYYSWSLQSNVPEYSESVLRSIGLERNTVIIWSVVLEVCTILAFLVIGLLLFVRKSHERMVYFASLMLVTWGGVNSTALASITILTRADLMPVRTVIAVIGEILFVWFLYSFPDGKYFPRWTRWIVTAYAFYQAAFWLVIFPSRDVTIANPTQVVMPLIVYSISVYVQLRRYYVYYTPAQRQQSKWITYGFSIALIGFIGLFLPQILFPVLAEPGIPTTVFKLIWDVFLTISLMAIPLTILFSMLRYRLWEADLAVNRGLVYGGLTLLLLLEFFCVSYAVQFALEKLLGRDTSGIAFAGAALLMGLLFQPTRRRMQGFIDKRFYKLNVNLRQVKMHPDEIDPVLLNAPRQFGPYQVTGFLGRGGMGEVYKGTHSVLNRDVAIKVLPATLAKDDSLRARFRREAQTISTLRHPNIIQLFDFGEAENTYYMVMEYISGPSLSEILKQRGKLPFAEAQRIVSDIASALDYASEQGVIHRDVKPSNVMMQPSESLDRAILMDFGIARLVSSASALTRSGVVGTLDYMAPEQFIEGGVIDGRADIYALGVMFYQMLTGKLPFAGDNPGVVIFGHLQRPAPDPRLLDPDIPTEAALTILRAMEKKPEDRFQRASEFTQVLEVVAV